MKLATIHSFDNQLTITSREVATMFTRAHGKILRTIRNVECDRSFFEQNFEEETYADAMGRKLPMFRITHAGFNFLITHFSGKKARSVRASLFANSDLSSQPHPHEIPNQISHNS